MQVNQRRLIAIVVAVAAAVLTFVLWPKPSLSPEELIQQKVVRMVRAAEEKDLGFIMEQVSESFRSGEGWDKQSLKGVLAMRVLRGDWVRIFQVNRDVKMLSSTAADFTGGFVFGRSEAKSVETLPKESIINAYSIEAKFMKEADGEWRVVSATHRVVDPMELF